MFKSQKRLKEVEIRLYINEIFINSTDILELQYNFCACYMKNKF